MSFCYEVPLINQNLQKNETVVQISNILSHLSKVSEDIFNRIDKRITVNSKNIKELQKRTELVEQKISKLKGIKSAIQVLSTSKYPSTESHKVYETVFTTSDCKFIRSSINYQHPVKRDENLEKLHMYHINLDVKPKEKTVGLGKIPKDVIYFGDTLLFNTGKNPYINAVNSSQKINKSRAIEDKSQDIGMAPASMRHKNYSNVSNSFFYTPDLGQVPTLDVPIDLPDLPGIADNLRYNDENSPTIAPSNSVQNSLLELTEEFNDLPEILTSSPPPPELPKPTTEETEPAPIDIEFKETLIVESSRANLMEAIREAGGLKRLKSVTKVKEVPSGNLMDDLHAKLSMRRKGISGPKPSNNPPGLSALSHISNMIPPPENSEKSDDSSQDDEWND